MEIPCKDLLLLHLLLYIIGGTDEGNSKLLLPNEPKNVPENYFIT